MSSEVHGHSLVYDIVAAVFLLLPGSDSGLRFGVAGVFATASSALHVAKAQTDTEL